MCSMRGLCSPPERRFAVSRRFIVAALPASALDSRLRPGTMGPPARPSATLPRFKKINERPLQYY